MAESVSSGPATEPLIDMDMSSADMSLRWTGMRVISTVPEVEEKVKEEPAEEQGEEVQEVAQGDEGQGEEEEGNTTPH